MKTTGFISICVFEFRRHLDVRGELLGLLLLVVIAMVKFGSDAIASGEAASPVFIGASNSLLVGKQHGRFNFVEDTSTKLPAGEPLLQLRGGGYVLKTTRPPSWLGELQSSLNVIEREHRLGSYGVGPDQVRDADAAVLIRVIGLDGQPLESQTLIAAVAVAVVVLTTLAILGCLGMLFHGLLGERFASATEMIISATPAGFWLDCKVTASILHGVKTVIVYGVYAAAGGMLLTRGMDGVHIASAFNWRVLIGLLVFCTSGLALWNWFFAACATAIRSPHSAFRNSLAAFPLTMILIGLGGLRAPDGAFMHALSYFPFTAMAAMPVRLLYTGVSNWEIALSLLMLVSTAALLRVWARHNFRTAIVAPIEAGLPVRDART